MNECILFLDKLFYMSSPAFSLQLHDGSFYCCLALCVTCGIMEFCFLLTIDQNLTFNAVATKRFSVEISDITVEGK